MELTGLIADRLPGILRSPPWVGNNRVWTLRSTAASVLSEPWLTALFTHKG